MGVKWYGNGHSDGLEHRGSRFYITGFSTTATAGGNVTDDEFGVATSSSLCLIVLGGHFIVPIRLGLHVPPTVSIWQPRFPEIKMRHWALATAVFPSLESWVYSSREAYPEQRCGSRLGDNENWERLRNGER